MGVVSISASDKGYTDADGDECTRGAANQLATREQTSFVSPTWHSQDAIARLSFFFDVLAQPFGPFIDRSMVACLGRMVGLFMLMFRHVPTLHPHQL